MSQDGVKLTTDDEILRLKLENGRLNEENASLLKTRATREEDLNN